MDENERIAEATETPDEVSEQDDTGETPVEAHRVGEFEEILARLDSLDTAINGLRDMLGTYRAVGIDNDATGSDADADTVEVDVAEADDFKGVSDVPDNVFFAENL